MPCSLALTIHKFAKRQHTQQKVCSIHTHKTPKETEH